MSEFFNGISWVFAFGWQVHVFFVLPVSTGIAALSVWVLRREEKRMRDEMNSPATAKEE